MPFLAFPLSSPFDGGGTSEEEPNNITKLLTAICQAGIQPLESCLQQLLTQRSIDTAIGVNLDVIGAIVAQPRNGLDDDTYRRYCRANITAHRSKGRVEDLITVSDLIIFDDDAVITVQPQPVATVVVAILGVGISDDLALVLFTFLQRTVAVGVRLILQYSTATPFQFDVGPGFDDGALSASV